MSSKRLWGLTAAALLALSAGCDLRIGPEPADGSAEESCIAEGFDPETAGYDECINEFSETN